MRLIGYFVVLFLSLIFQSTIFQVPWLQPFAPSLIVIALVLVGVFRGAREGLIFGIVIGLIQDTSFGSFLGQSAFAYALIGYVSGYLRSMVIRVSLFLSLLLVAISTEFYVWLSYAVSRLFGQLGTDLHTVTITSTHMTLSTLVFTLFLYPFYQWLLVHKAKKTYPDATDES